MSARPARTLAVGVACLLAVGGCTQRPAPSTSAGGRTLESILETAALDPRRASGVELIQSPTHPEESLLWLRALAVSSVTGPRGGKLTRLLDCDPVAPRECRHALTQNSAAAVIVSRTGLDQLRPVRGPLDVERLERYATWAGRPESITLRETVPGRLELHADLGPGDAILVRREFHRDWRVQPATVRLREDPVGYLVLDPQGASGPIDIVLEGGPPTASDQAVASGEFPLIQAEGVVDGTTFAGPPFAPGTVLSIFGKRFADAGNEVRLGDVRLKPLYESATQINVPLPADLPPGTHDLTVTANGRGAEPYAIEVAP